MAEYRAVGAEHVAVYVTDDEPIDQFTRLRGGAARRRRPDRTLTGRDRGPMDRTAHIVGTATTPMQRRDLTIEAMAHQVVDHALSDAGMTPDQVDLVVVRQRHGRAPAQPGLHPRPELPARRRPAQRRDHQRRQLVRRRGLGPPPGHPGHPGRGRHRCWRSASRRCGPGTGCETLAGIEDGVPERRPGPSCTPTGRTRRARCSWPSTPSGPSSTWRPGGRRVEQIAAAAVKARRHGALNPHAQFQSEVTLDEVLASPPSCPPLTRLMCSSFTDGAAAVVLVPRAAAGGTADPGQHGAVGQRRHRLPRPAGRDGGRGLGRVRRRPGRRRRGRAARRHQRRGDLRPRVARLLQARRRRGGHRRRRHHPRGPGRDRQHQRRTGQPGPSARGHRASPRWSS